jgi:hypothetical protein
VRALCAGDNISFLERERARAREREREREKEREGERVIITLRKTF